MARAFGIVAAVIALIGVGWSQAHAAVAVQACATEKFTGTNTSISVTGVTVSAGSNLALTLTVVYDIAGATVTPTVSSAVWDQVGANQALVKVNSGQVSGTGPNVETWALVNPTPGTNKTITATISAAVSTAANACAWTGVDQTGGATSFPHTAATQSATTVSVTSASGNIVLGGAAAIVGLSGITGTTIYNDSINGANVNDFSNWDNGAASVSIGSGNTNVVVVGTDIKAAGGAAPSCPHTLAATGAGC